MTLAEAVLSVMFVGLIAYGLFGGADFGAGIWDLLAGGTRRGARQRELIEHSIAPVWEANHVWLIFVLVVLWTGFPGAFVAVVTTLYVPLTLAAFGMIARGAAFAFRKSMDTLGMRRFLGASFALSSLVTPFFLGAVVGGVASGRVPPGIAAGDVITSWINPTSVLGGTMAVLTCAYLAAVFLCGDARREGAEDLADQFRVRALATAAVTGALGVAGLLVLRADAPLLYERLTGRAVAVIALSVAAGLVAVLLLVRRQYLSARLASALAVAAILAGWAVAQYPYILLPELTIEEAAGGRATLTAIIVALLGGAVLLVPSLVYLFRLFQRTKGGPMSQNLKPSGNQHRVVVVGGGFGGLSVVSALAHADVQITLVDRTNHHLFQPLLYQVAAGILPPGLIAPAIRSVIKKQANVRALLADVHDLDLENGVVRAEGLNGRLLELPYDSLIVAAGATHSYFGRSEWAEFAPGMKTVEDARNLRDHLLSAFEMAELATDPEERAEWLTFVVVGAGPTGVELVGQVAELAHTVLPRDYRSVDTREARILLLEGAPAVLPPFAPKLQQYTLRRLEKMGVEIRTGTLAVDMDDHTVTVKGPDGEETIRTRTRIWAAGVQASPLARLLAERSGAETDRAGRILVNPDCTLPGHPEVFAIGDMVSLNGLPGVAQPAMQEGKYVGKVIRGRLAGDGQVKPFKYFDKGNMATIGYRAAVADAFGMKVTGLLAYLMWGFIHVLYLIGWGNRLGTLYSWLRALVFTKNRGHRIITFEEAHQQALQHVASPGIPAARAAPVRTEDPTPVTQRAG